MNITAKQFRQMSRYERAMILPRYLDTLLWLESIHRLSDYGKDRLEKLRAVEGLTHAPCR